MAGRITEEYDNDFQVDLPDGRSVYVREAVIYVRCDEISDPMETLFVHGHETAFFHKHRVGFLRSVIRQRAAFHGLTALASAGVELYPHQVEIVRRVLEDPIQRYLLADEVGLGKTIEAGILIRQFIIDDPTGNVVVAAPSSLIAQWNEELSQRFQLSDANVQVVDVAKLDEAEIDDVGLLVVDEAHHPAAGAHSDDPILRARYASLARIAHATDRLLLLSATPASNHEREFLAMLHLLDPATYRLDGLAEFQARVAKRQVIGRLLLSIREDADAFVLEQTAGRIVEVLPGDTALRDLAKDLTAALAEADGQRTREAVRLIRAHIGEVYRIHHRMLRTRRDELGGVMAARASESDHTPWMLEVPDGRVLDAYRLIDDWRAYAVAQLDIEAPVGSEALSDLHLATLRLCQRMLDGAATSLPMLEAIVSVRLGVAAVGGFPLSEAESKHVAIPPTFPEERGILRALLAISQTQADAMDRTGVLADYLVSERQRVGVKLPPKCVVFTNDARVANELNARLVEKLGRKYLASITADGTTQDEELARFVISRDCFVLVCDRRAEEGLNLQFAEQLVLYDLPWSPNQLEQRIGRLDRIGRTRHVKTVMFQAVNDDESIVVAWLSLLRDKLRIFHESVAGLQFFLNAQMPALESALLQEGAQGLRAAGSRLVGDILGEKHRLREQGALDEIDASTEHASRFFSTLDDIDAEAATMRASFEGWACSVLDLRRRDGLHGDVASYEASKHTKIPKSLLRQAVSPHLDKKCTFKRDVAVREPGVSLVRIGHGLVDGLCRYIEWDDRGSTYAIWRWEPTWKASEREPWMGFRLHYSVQPDLRASSAQLTAGGLPKHAWQAFQRRADAAFPPTLVSLVFDVTASEVTEPTVLDALKEPFKKVSEGGRDFNLHKGNGHILRGLMSADHWEWACRNVRTASEASLRARKSFTDRRSAGILEVERRSSLEAAQSSARATAAHVEDLPELRLRATQRALASQVLREAVQKPAVRLESVGFVVISAQKHPSLANVE